MAPQPGFSTVSTRDSHFIGIASYSKEDSGTRVC